MNIVFYARSFRLAIGRLTGKQQDPIWSLQKGQIMPKLTKRILDTVPIPTKGDTILWDTEIRGFGCRIWPSGRKIFFVRYRAARGRRRYTIGPYGVLTVEEARTRAARTLADVYRGEDPAAAKRVETLAPTVTVLAQRYLTDHAELEKKPRSIAEDRRNLHLHILPLLGHLPVHLITTADCNTLRRKLAKTPIAANRCRALLSTMFNLAETWGLRPKHSNPAADVPSYKERKRQRFMTLEELSRLGQALEDAEGWGHPSAVPAIRFLLLTGCRLREALTLQWEDIRVADRVARLRDSKTGPRPLYLSEDAMTLLQSLPHKSEWVFPGRRKEKPLSTLQKVWQRVRTDAGISEDVRIHDLRHSFASLGAQAGVNMLFIKDLLGHERMTTTERYTHAGTDPVKHAAVIIGKLVGTALNAR